MSKAIAALTAARGAYTYEQVGAAAGLTADQVRRTELAPISTPTFWLLSLCHVYDLDFADMARMVEADTREITGLEKMVAGKLHAEATIEQTAMEFL